MREEKESFMFEDGKCPMLKADVIQRYGLSDDFVKRFCGEGCSVECGKFLAEILAKKGHQAYEGRCEK